MKTIKQKAEEYHEIGFLQRMGVSNKEFVEACEKDMTRNMVNELSELTCGKDFKVTIEYNRRKKYKCKYIIEVKGM